MDYLRAAKMRVRAATTAGQLDSKKMSAGDVTIAKDSMSMPNGHITPPEEVTGGMNGFAEHVPRQLSQPLSPSSQAVEAVGHGGLVLSRWDKFVGIISGRGQDLVVDGVSLDLATIVAVARSVS